MILSKPCPNPPIPRCEEETSQASQGLKGKEPQLLSKTFTREICGQLPGCSLLLCKPLHWLGIQKVNLGYFCWGGGAEGGGGVCALFA